MGYFMEGASYCCFRIAFSSNFFQQILLINIISTCPNLLQHFFFFSRFLLIEDYGKCALRKEPVIGCSFKHHFSRVVLINSIDTNSKLLKSFIFVHFLLLFTGFSTKEAGAV